MKLLWLSNAPWSPSGYGTQSATVTPRLKALGHDVTIAAFFGLEGSATNWNGITVLPRTGEDMFAQDTLARYYEAYKCDLLITFMDAWALNPGYMQTMNVAHWMPVDCKPLSRLDKQILIAGNGHPVAFSKFGQKNLEDAGFCPLYVPHSVDTSVFKPAAERDAIRAEVGLQDRFIVGMNAANLDACRKGFGEQFAAFAEFSKCHDDAILLVHARSNTMNGADLNEMARQRGIADAVMFADQTEIFAGRLNSEHMMRWYSILDAFSNASYGEGFGIPILEAQACGTPVVVNDCTAMTEMCGAGWLATGQKWWNARHSADWQVPYISSIAEAYEKAYAEAASLREQAREFSLQYDATKVLLEYWQPALEKLAELSGA